MPSAEKWRMKYEQMKIISDTKDGDVRTVVAVPEGVCSRLIELTMKGDVIENVEFQYGCNGNLKGIGALVRGMKATDAAARLRGIECGGKGTSCPDQFARLLEAVAGN